MEEESIFRMNEKELDKFWNYVLDRLKTDSTESLCDIINGNCLLYSHIKHPDQSLSQELVKKVKTHVNSCWFCSEYYRENEEGFALMNKEYDDITGKTDLKQRIKYNRRITQDGAELGIRILYIIESARDKISLSDLTKATFSLEKRLGLLEEGTQDFDVLIAHLVRNGFITAEKQETNFIPDISAHVSNEDFSGENFYITSKGCNLLSKYKPYLSKQFHLDERTITTILGEIKRD